MCGCKGERKQKGNPATEKSGNPVTEEGEDGGDHATKQWKTKMIEKVKAALHSDDKTKGEENKDWKAKALEKAKAALASDDKSKESDEHKDFKAKVKTLRAPYVSD
eukprot:4710934-Pyramimonas_sp.AAC.1